MEVKNKQTKENESCFLVSSDFLLIMTMGCLFERSVVRYKKQNIICRRKTK